MNIPAFHYMIAVAGGNSIRCAPYATFGTQELSDRALQALSDRKACLLANHGMIAAGDSLKHALALAVEVEALCEQYWRALQIGKPAILSDSEMEVVLEKFKTYGKGTKARRASR
jgi:L-fuculose-phosphate aldolase